MPARLLSGTSRLLIQCSFFCAALLMVPATAKSAMSISVKNTERIPATKDGTGFVFECKSGFTDKAVKNGWRFDFRASVSLRRGSKKHTVCYFRYLSEIEVSVDEPTWVNVGCSWSGYSNNAYPGITTAGVLFTGPEPDSGSIPKCEHSNSTVSTKAIAIEPELASARKCLLPGETFGFKLTFLGAVNSFAGRPHDPVSRLLIRKSSYAWVVDDGPCDKNPT